MSRFHTRSAMVHVRITHTDRRRLELMAETDGRTVSDVVRHLVSTGLRTEDNPPLEPVTNPGRQKGAKNRPKDHA